MEGEAARKKLTLTRREAAEYIGVHINTLDRSDIPRLYFGAKVLFMRETLDKYFAEMEQARRPRCRK